MPSGRQVKLAAHDQELTVVEVGGGIRSYSAASTPVFDGYSVEEMCSGGRGQLLAPWPNRLADGRFEWDDETNQCPINEVETGNAIHGLVRWSSWEVTAAADDHARMAYRLHPQPGWPWAMDVAVTYRLLPGGLSVHTELRNLSQRTCPAGFGWHPYLYAFGGSVDDAVLVVEADKAYSSDERGLPTGRYDVTGTDSDFRGGRRIGDARLDVCFTDLRRDADGLFRVLLRSGDGSASAWLWADAAYSHLMVFSGDTLADPRRRRRGLAVEPMTGAPNFLRSGDGLCTLGPGEALEGTWGTEIYRK